MVYAVNGDVVITATAVPVQIVTYSVKATLTNLFSSPAIVDATTVKEGETFSFTLSANNGYMLPASITIKSPVPLWRQERDIPTMPRQAK